MAKRIKTAYIRNYSLEVETVENSDGYEITGYNNIPATNCRLEGYTSTTVTVVNLDTCFRTVYDADLNQISSSYATEIHNEKLERENAKNGSLNNDTRNTDNSCNDNNSNTYEFGDFIGDIFNTLEKHEQKKELERAEKEKIRAEKEKERNIQRELNDRIKKIEQARHEKIMKVHKKLKGEWF